MRFGFLLATAMSLTAHTLMLWLLPTLSSVGDTPLNTPINRFQARLLPPQAEPRESAVPIDTAQPSAPARTNAAPWRGQKLPVLTATTSAKMSAGIATAPSSPSPTTVPAASGTSSSSAGFGQPAAPAVATQNAPLDLTIRVSKLPPRTALQSAIEQQAIRPDAMARGFERVLEQTGPVTTEITQKVDANGNATVKVRTAGGTYCLKNSTPAGATLYELKTLAGNCSQ